MKSQVSNLNHPFGYPTYDNVGNYPEISVGANPVSQMDTDSLDVQFQRLIESLGGIDGIVRAMNTPKMRRIIKELQPALLTALTSFFSTAPSNGPIPKKKRRRQSR
jgi:hypothetical protein